VHCTRDFCVKPEVLSYVPVHVSLVGIVLSGTISLRIHFLILPVAKTVDNLGIGAGNVKHIARADMGSISAGGLVACSGIYSNLKRRGCLRRGIVDQPVPPIPPHALTQAHSCTSACMPVSIRGVTGSGRMVCVYQNQIPPALMALSFGGFPEPSRSLAESVLFTLESASSMRDAEGETVASNSRLATITNSRTSTSTVIAVICFMVQVSSDDARGAHIA
jgi:hypothetical protein